MSFMPRPLQTWTAILMIAAMGLLNVGPAAAGIAPSRVSGQTALVSVRDADLVIATRALENRIVAQKLQDYGVSTEAAAARIASLSDQDLHTLAQSSKGLPSGGDGATGAVIGVLIVVILVIVIMRMMNKQVIVR